jgi:hypothetical protein
MRNKSIKFQLLHIEVFAVIAKIRRMNFIRNLLNRSKICDCRPSNVNVKLKFVNRNSKTGNRKFMEGPGNV